MTVAAYVPQMQMASKSHVHTKFVSARFESRRGIQQWPFARMLPLLLLPLAYGCPPQPNGNCYAGSYYSGADPAFSNQRCGNDAFRDWCAVTYQPANGMANFGCANSFPIQLGTPICGIGIDRQGCNTVQTPNGPCLMCCCKGGSCNHPQASYFEYCRYEFEFRCSWSKHNCSLGEKYFLRDLNGILLNLGEYLLLCYFWMDVYCGACRKMHAFVDVTQLLPCLHTICTTCIQKVKSKVKICPVEHCYSPLSQPPEFKWNPCENDQCVRKLSPVGEVFRTLCLHELCAKCVDDAYKTENPICPVVGCGVSLLDEEDREKCSGPCGSTMDTTKLITLSCCGMRMCALCAEKWTEGKGGCPVGKCQPPEKRKKKGKKEISVAKVPCQGQPECEGEVLRNFPSDQECEHAVCIQCVHLTLIECENRGTAPICPAESCRLPYRCETVLALRALFPEKSGYFNRFDLESNYSLEALKDESVMKIFACERWKPVLIHIKTCFCEDEENLHAVEFDTQGTLGDMLREIRRVLKIMPWDKVYGYFRRELLDLGADKAIDVKPKSLQASVASLKISKETLILVDITGIVNSKREQTQSLMTSIKTPPPAGKR